MFFRRFLNQLLKGWKAMTVALSDIASAVASLATASGNEAAVIAQLRADNAKLTSDLAAAQALALDPVAAQSIIDAANAATAAATAAATPPAV